MFSKALDIFKARRKLKFNPNQNTLGFHPALHAIADHIATRKATNQTNWDQAKKYKGDTVPHERIHKELNEIHNILTQHGVPPGKAKED